MDLLLGWVMKRKDGVTTLGRVNVPAQSVVIRRVIGATNALRD